MLLRLFISLLFLSSTFILKAESPAFFQFPPMDVVYHPVTTNDPEAQKAFNRGLLAIYAFNKEEHLSYNQAIDVLKVANDLLLAGFVKEEKGLDASIEYLVQAVQKQDHLNYIEPPDWFYPIRQTLGAAYMEAKKFETAELTFREALERLPRNGRSLFGLMGALKSQNKFIYWTEREAREALRYSEHPLSLKDL